MALGFNPVRTIVAKRDGRACTPEEIDALIQGSLRGDVADAQLAAWAMAVYFQGMTAKETAALTRSMLDSGARLVWPAGTGPYVDKHSTGGIGDKISLILAPLLAACGLRVPMLSGRGLGPTGGTLDKLESIPGFRTDLDLEAIRRQVADIGCVITGTTAEIAPADRKLYALRDVTGTVPSIPLITASIMSKKLAEGLDALVLDVKWGSGAFMKTQEDARKLAESLVRTGREMGVRTTALLTDMNQPLGHMIGNTCEVAESIDVLQGNGPEDVRALVIALGSELLVQSGIESTPEAAGDRLTRALDGGAAFEVFEAMVAAQGGRLAQRVPAAKPHDCVATEGGFIQTIDGEALGYAVIELGGGRRKPGEAIDPRVGLECLVRIGDTVEPGQPLARILAPAQRAEPVKSHLACAFRIGAEAVSPPPLIVDRIEERTE